MTEPQIHTGKTYIFRNSGPDPRNGEQCVITDVIGGDTYDVRFSDGAMGVAYASELTRVREPDDRAARRDLATATALLTSVAHVQQITDDLTEVYAAIPGSYKGLAASLADATKAFAEARTILETATQEALNR